MTQLTQYIGGVSKKAQQHIFKKEKAKAIEVLTLEQKLSYQQAVDQVNALEKQMQQRFPDLMGMKNPPSNIEQEIQHLLAQNKKIEAIKLYRSTYQVDLKTAKNAVEAISPKLKKQSNYIFWIIFFLIIFFIIKDIVNF